MHSYLCSELLAQIGGISDVVKIAVGDNDQREMSWLSACADKFFFKVSALVGTPGVDQDIIIVGFDEITVDAAQFEGERQIDRVDFCRHVVVLSCVSFS